MTLHDLARPVEAALRLRKALADGGGTSTPWPPTSAGR
jgi:hypothetical protein